MPENALRRHISSEYLKGKLLPGLDVWNHGQSWYDMAAKVRLRRVNTPVKCNEIACIAPLAALAAGLNAVGKKMAYTVSIYVGAIGSRRPTYLVAPISKCSAFAHDSVVVHVDLHALFSSYSAIGKEMGATSSCYGPDAQ